MEQMEQTLKSITHMLPDTICIEQERREADNALRMAVQDLQGAYKGLSGIEELSPIGTNIADITESMVRERIYKRIELVKQDMSLTEGEKNARLGQWQSILGRATRYVRVIERILKEWPSAIWEYDTQIENFYCSNLDATINALATHTVTEEAKEHFRRVWECIEKIRDLRAWENKHDIKSIHLCELQCMSAKAFGEMWQNGIKFDRVIAAKYGFEVGNFKDPKHPERTII